MTEPVAARNQNRRWRLRLLLLATSTVLSLLALEVAFRLLVFGADGLSVRMMNSVHPFGVSGLLQDSPYPGLIWELKPKQTALFKLAPLVTNSQGQCDREYPLAKPASCFRVAVVGDSLTMADGVALEDAYHSVLEAELNSAGLATTFEFINFGVSGYYLCQYVAAIEQKALAYSPDLILVGFCARNDSLIPPPDYMQVPYQPLPVTHPAFNSFVWQQIWQRLVPEEDEQPGDPHAEESYLRENFVKLKRISDQHAIPVVIAHLSNRPETTEPVETLARQCGLRFVDTSAAFAGTSYRDQKIYLIDGHPNARAHATFARVIREYLLGQHLLPTARKE